MVGLYVNGELVAFGRASRWYCIFWITDVMVDPAYEDSGADMRSAARLMIFLVVRHLNDGGRILAMTNKK